MAETIIHRDLPTEANIQTIAEFMSDDHHSCDDAFAVAEQAVLDTDWGKAETSFNDFRTHMTKHFRMEEDALFPALTSAGGPAGPVQMMRMEHSQMNSLIGQMAGTLASRDAHEYGGLSETLLILMQQHNLKEEQILYPMADQFLATERKELLGRMQAA